MTIIHGLDWQGFGRSLEGIPFSLEPPRVKEKSRDFYWFSPVLRRTLCSKYGDILVMPRSEADVMKVAKRCVEWKVPLTVRGAGTGNYGQAMPLEGGVILEMTAMNAIRWLRPGMIRCEAGLKLIDLDEVPMHLEFVRLEGQIGCFGIQLLKFHSEERLNEIIRYHEDHGVPVFNPHTSTLEDGGMKVVDPLQLGFKREVDPYGLLNPGKMRGWWEDKTVQAHDGALYR